MSDEELSLETLDGTVRTIVALWGQLSDWQRVGVADMSRDLRDALDVLAEGEFPAPAVKPVEPPREYPAELRVKDLENALKAVHRRADALYHARKSWTAACDVGQGVSDHALSVISVAEAYEKYLTDGTVPPPPEGRKPFETAPTPVPPITGVKSHPECQGIHCSEEVAAVFRAAAAWVDQSHTHNLGGPENWRNWADDHDVDLINAVLAFRGLPPLERKAM